MTSINYLNNLIASLENSKMKKYDEDNIQIEVSFTFNQPADIKEIKKFETQLNVKLPNSFKHFLSSYNGARIYDYDNIDGFILFGISEIINLNKLAQATFDEDWNDKILIYGKYIGENNYLGFYVEDDYSEYKVIDCYFDDVPNNWRIIAKDFDDFIKQIVENNGNKYWLSLS